MGLSAAKQPKMGRMYGQHVTLALLPDLYMKADAQSIDINKQRANTSHKVHAWFKRIFRLIFFQRLC